MKKFDIQRWGNPISIALLCICAYLLLLVGYAPILHKLELLNLFLPTADYFSQNLSTPGGLISWAASYLTQFCYFPWLGALIYVAILALLQWMTTRALCLKKEMSITAILLPAMLLLAFLNLGYLIYSIKTRGIAFSPLLGTASILALLWGIRVLANATRPWVRHLAFWLPALSVVVLYPLLGAYALISAVLSCIVLVRDLRPAQKTAWLMMAIAFAATLCAIIAWPQWWVRHSNAVIYQSHIYTAMLPRYTSGEFTLWWPYAVAALYLVLGVSGALEVSKRAKSAKSAKSAKWIALGSCIAALASLFVLRDSDENLTATVAMQNALDDMDYARALDVAMSMEQEPTRLNVMLGEAALNRIGRAADYMFALPNGSAPYQTPRNRRALHDAGAYIPAYHYGRINYAYRFAMEYMVEYGPRVEHLKYMTRCALLNGEYDLARKHLDVLSRTLFHRDWARRYYSYLQDPQTMEHDPELRSIKPLTNVPDYIGTDQGAYERYLRPTLAQTPPTNLQILDLSLQNLLANKEVSKFLTRIDRYLALHPELPKHYQEALVLGDHIKHGDVSSRYPIDPRLRERFEQFTALNKRYSNLSEDEQRAIMKPIFGDTYWYYFVYVKDLMQI